MPENPVAGRLFRVAPETTAEKHGLSATAIWLLCGIFSYQSDFRPLFSVVFGLGGSSRWGFLTERTRFLTGGRPGYRLRTDISRLGAFPGDVAAGGFSEEPRKRKPWVVHRRARAFEGNVGGKPNPNGLRQSGKGGIRKYHHGKRQSWNQQAAVVDEEVGS